jgi:predicted transposase/invertase (TIGR01784 family)
MMISAEKYINPFTDFGFKKLFGTEVNKDLLMDFLNELIHFQGAIKEVKYLNAEQLGRSEEDRRAVFDIYCETETGEKFIVEMQKARHNYFKDRSLYYASFPIREQSARGDWNYRLNAIYTVGILNFVFNESKDDESYYHSEVKLMDIRKKTVFYDKLTFIYLEMPKFNKSVEQLETRFEKWMYVLKNLPRLQELPPQLQERIFEKMFRVAEIAKMNRQEVAEYEDSLKIYRDLYSVMETAKMEGEKKGKQIGEKIGEERGRMEGRIEGKVEGRIEGKKEAALKMLADGVSVENICKYTGLSEEQVQAVIKAL